MQELPPKTVVFGKHVPCPRCRTQGHKPHNRGWVWIVPTMLLSTDTIIETMPAFIGEKHPTRVQKWYRIQCRVCHGKGFTEHTYVAERVEDV